MKLYVLFDGIYSDRYVVGCFDNIVQAEEIKYLLDDGEIVEYELNELQRPKDHFVFCVEIEKDGTILKSIKENELDCITINKTKIVPRWWPKENRHTSVLYTHMWAKDEQHAIKIANERRIMILANNQWSKDFPYTEVK